MQKSSVMAKKRLGAYYTPMNVVQFLLHSSLQQQINSIAQKVKEAVKKKDHLSTSNAISHLSEIKVLDPSCGDGIFLVEALKLIEEGYEKIKLICQEGDLRLHDLDEQAYQILLTAITPRIALDNLYGVDIDATAVKNTIERLQSYLVSGKPANCYHGIRNPLENFKCALGLNIKVGNALKVPPLNWNAESKEAKEWTEDLSLYREKIRKKINLDIQQGDSCFNEAFLKNRIAKLCSSVLNKSRLVLEQMLLERPETCLRDLDDLFIWELNFPEVFIRKNQGFDIICGNPPYINLETIRNSPLNHFLRTSSRWRDLYRGKGDIQYHFLMLAIQLLREKGHLAMITSRYWPENKNADILRKQLINQARVLRLLDLGASVLFDAGIHNLLLILQKSCSESHYAFKFARLEELNLPILEFLIRENKINWEKLLAQEVFSRDGGAWRLLSGEVSSLVARIESILKEGEHHGFRLDELTHIGEGIKTGNDTVFASFEYVGAGYYRNRFDEEVQMYKFEKGLMRPVITSSKEIIPFHIAPSESYLLCTHKIGKRINQYPNAQSYLKRFIANLDKLRGVKNNSRPLGKRYAVVTEKKTPYDVVRYNERIFGPWNYQKEKFDFPKEGVIFGRYRNKTACFALSDKDLCCLTNTIAISSKKLYGCSMRYLLALLNSQVADFYIHFGRKKKKGAVQEYRRSTLQDVPIRIPHLQNPDEKRIHDTIVAKTEILEDLQQRILHGRCQSEDLQKQYYQTKKELDQIFFQLYNLESLSERIAHHLAISA